MDYQTTITIKYRQCKGPVTAHPTKCLAGIIPANKSVPGNNPDHFNRDFYCKAYKDVNAKFINPYVHYYTVGRSEERLPNAETFRELYPHIDLQIYARHNGDLATMSMEELMSHFHHRGRFECRKYRDDVT